ncbi:glycerol kinase GlpK [Weissella oryzae]|uniref:glycerol kinase GlpK n=1 Tax=Weissella oryzae TaxID=1129792 RepID=UPI000489D6C8|nr:glycerol kinase GlpK [Weissella oryzae]
MAIKKPEYILAIDQGTTGTRAVVFNHNARRVTTQTTPLTSLISQTGWLEQRPLDIWSSVQTAIADALIQAGVRGDEIRAVGIANQRETTIIWDKRTGQPIYNAVVWSSIQSQEVAEALADQAHMDLIREKTGLPLSTYFSATKIRWILDHVEGAQALAEAGDLLFGTVDTWLIWNLTDGEIHATDISNASRTMLFNINTLEWDDELLALFNIPKSMLPIVKPSGQIFGNTNPMRFFGGSVPIAGVIGDQNASLVGQLAVKPGMIKSTYGAGAFMMLNTGSKPVTSKRNLVTTIAYQIGDRPVYALEGSVFAAGTALQWLHDELDIIDTQLDAWEAAEASTNEDEVYVVPAFNGLGAPYWDPNARGAVFGMTRGTNRNDFIKATLQSVAYQTADILEIMADEYTGNIHTIMADGSVARNPYLMQFQADVTGVTIKRATDEDTTPLGVAFLAGLAIGYWSSLENLQHLIDDGRKFYPAMPIQHRDNLIDGWQRAIRATQYFGNNDSNR